MKAGPLWREPQGSGAWLFYNLIYNWESCLHQLSSQHRELFMVESRERLSENDSARCLHLFVCLFFFL